VVLAAVTTILGFGEHALSRFLYGPVGGPTETLPHHWLPYTAIALTIAAVTLAWVEFGRRGAPQVGFIERSPAVRDLFANRWYIDRVYRWLLDRVVYDVFSRLCARNDQKVIDGAVDGLAISTAAAGSRMARLHTGMVQHRLMVVFVSLVCLAFYFFV
jgi:NADH-quinone oxidoreductase subunit L